MAVSVDRGSGVLLFRIVIEEHTIHHLHRLLNAFHHQGQMQLGHLAWRLPSPGIIELILTRTIPCFPFFSPSRHIASFSSCFLIPPALYSSSTFRQPTLQTSRLGFSVLNRCLSCGLLAAHLANKEQEAQEPKDTGHQPSSHISSFSGWNLYIFQMKNRENRLSGSPAVIRTRVVDVEAAAHNHRRIRSSSPRCVSVNWGRARNSEQIKSTIRLSEPHQFTHRTKTLRTGQTWQGAAGKW